MQYSAKSRIIGRTWQSGPHLWEVLEMVKPGLYRAGVMVPTKTGGRVAIRLMELYANAIRRATEIER